VAVLVSAVQSPMPVGYRGWVGPRIGQDVMAKRKVSASTENRKPIILSVLTPFSCSALVGKQNSEYTVV
jgi:hypothetical protein